MCSVLQWLQIPQERKTCTDITSHSQYCLLCSCICFCFKKSIMNPDMTEFCHISSVGAFIAVYVHKCKYFSWNNQKSMELMQYYNPGFPVSLKPILKNCSWNLFIYGGTSVSNPYFLLCETLLNFFIKEKKTRCCLILYIWCLHSRFVYAVNELITKRWNCIKAFRGYACMVPPESAYSKLQIPAKIN